MYLYSILQCKLSIKRFFFRINLKRMSPLGISETQMNFCSLCSNPFAISSICSSQSIYGNHSLYCKLKAIFDMLVWRLQLHKGA
ncbi:hypothetical protein VNO80_14426 [Phaseolus coccineus]|uniref:Uncharacterized protein n=1 Tax=Phaseolus coccineus TaxID=3886 RepID=A0AAN9MPH8_PHACN